MESERHRPPSLLEHSRRDQTFLTPEPRPSPWTASPRGYEDSPSLSQGIASPEKRNHPRRTLATRHRA
jgi:hypothetical protein